MIQRYENAQVAFYDDDDDTATVIAAFRNPALNEAVEKAAALASQHFPAADVELTAQRDVVNQLSQGKFQWHGNPVVVAPSAGTRGAASAPLIIRIELPAASFYHKGHDSEHAITALKELDETWDDKGGSLKNYIGFVLAPQREDSSDEAAVLAAWTS